MKLPWRRLAEVAGRVLRKRNEKHLLLTCAIDGTELNKVHGERDLYVCVGQRHHTWRATRRGAELVPEYEIGLINQGDHRGEI